ncbi:MAG: hypothetical protein BGP04_01955 [Rhizobiales bacterium 62-17]|nr:MAG: hypothetical protein BGP04_01955 [Rhizobiales bacterium 62-17]
MPSAGSYFDLYKREGLRLALDRDSYVDRYIIEHGTWEANQIFFLKQLLMKCPNDGSRLAFLDIGAYFGLYSVHMARTAAFDEIHAFEADTLNFRQLQANLLLNDPDMKVQAHNFAVASKDDEVQFLPSWKHPTGNRGGVGMLRDDHSEIHQSVRIKSKALDSILHLKGYTIIAKIDVEGWDFDVLLGMEKLLNENRCAIQIECLPDNDASDENKQRIDNFLNERGYRSFHSIGVDLYYSNFL